MSLAILLHRSFFLLCLLAILVSCHDHTNAYTELTGKAQGTTFSIKYNDPYNRDLSPQMDSLFRLIDQSMSLWDSTSIISRINRNENVKLDVHFEKVISRALEISSITNGAFDITIGPLIRLWNPALKMGSPLPDSMTVDSIRSYTGFDKISLADGILKKDHPKIELDVNAIAQGYTVDLISNFLISKRIENFMVELGGEVRAQGVNERDSFWVIGIDKPVEASGQERTIQTTVALHNQSIATSGSYRKFYERDGKKYSHVIDPGSGYPVGHQLLSVSVIAGDCTSADAFATAFLVMGMERSFELAGKLDMEIYCIYINDDGGTDVRSSAGFGSNLSDILILLR